MKSINKTLIKIFGIIFMYWSISGLISLVAMLPQYKQVTGGSKLALPMVIANTMAVLICAIIGFIMLIKTEWLMRLLQIKEENANIDDKNIFPVGCKLIGIYIFVSEIGAFFTAIIMILETVRNKQRSFFPGDIQRFAPKETPLINAISILIPLILSFMLIFRTKSLIKFVKKFEK
ncbi:MAG: hypothetical protein E4H23_10905 [Chrysiogenales bacterium]|nr:MAG: hypothetical protein E4H23_10905 [Chrysiogenales bacterium]